MTNIQLAKGGGGTLYRPGQFETFTDDNIASRVQFAKVEFASEQVIMFFGLIQARADEN